MELLIVSPSHLLMILIIVKLFLPSSRVIPLTEPIPFFVTIFGDEDTLDPFAAYQPSSASFHPFSESHGLVTSLHQFTHRATSHQHQPPVRLQLQRHTTVDPAYASLMYAREKASLGSTKNLGQCTIHNMNRHRNSITWSGTIAIPTTVTSGGFTASGVKVAVSFWFKFINFLYLPHDPDGYL